MRFQSDLKWLLESPEFLQLDETVSAQNLVNKCQFDDGFSYQKTHRLGVYFEQLWHHLVQSSPDLALLHKNLQVIIDNHTYGEFDSIISNNNKVTHCEMAVKFYLQVGAGVQLSDWVGPNLKDRFDDKYQRLFQHQLQLSAMPEIQPWLKQKSIKIDEKRLLTRGRLFYPFEQFLEKEFTFPSEVNPKHDKGFWVRYFELNKLLSNSDYQWLQLPRFYWFSEIEKIDNELLPVEKNFEGFSLQKIVALKEGKEVLRGFVVNDDWLHKARQRVLD